MPIPLMQNRIKICRTILRLTVLPVVNVDSYGVVNLAAAPLIPDKVIKRKAAKAVQGTGGQVYFDTDAALSKAWNLKNANNASCVILVDKDRIIRFYKAGQVSRQEMQQVINTVNDWK